MASKHQEHDCEWGERKHPAIFEINLYEGIFDASEGEDERGKVLETTYSCMEHLTHFTENFRENPKNGDEIRNLRNEMTYWRIRDALREIDQFHACIEVYDPNPISRLQCVQQKMMDYLGSPGEIKKEGDKTILIAKGGLESIMALARDELKNMDDISFSMHVDRKDQRYK